MFFCQVTQGKYRMIFKVELTPEFLILQSLVAHSHLKDNINKWKYRVSQKNVYMF